MRDDSCLDLERSGRNSKKCVWKIKQKSLDNILDLGNGMGKEWKNEAWTMACDTELLREPHGICSMAC